MPFQAGNQLGRKNLGRKRESPKTLWVLESLRENGYDYEGLLVKFLKQAATGDRHAYAMAELLIKLVPHLANAPKAERAVTNIETLVIHRHDPAKVVTPQPYVDTTAEPEGNPPLSEGESA